MFVVILAQSAATSRAYAAKYDEEDFSEATDLVRLGAANAAAAFTGTFVVNGSPTKAQIVDQAGGRSQLTQLSASAVILVVLLLLTGPLAYLPAAALATVVFLIVIQLIDVKEMRRFRRLTWHEFTVALITTGAVVVLGVEDGIILAVVVSIINHLRHSYSPLDSVLVKSSLGHLGPLPVEPGARTEEGLVIYRFGTSLYFANAAKLMEDIAALVGHGGPLRWFVLDCAAIEDVDYTASSVLTRVVEYLQRRHIRIAVSSVLIRCGSSSTVTASARPWILTRGKTVPARPSRPTRRHRKPSMTRTGPAQAAPRSKGSTMLAVRFTGVLRLSGDSEVVRAYPRPPLNVAGGRAGACGAATARTSVSGTAPQRRRRARGRLVPPAR